MREIELGRVYELRDNEGNYSQKITFSSEENPQGTNPAEVLNAVIEKLYSNQFRNFSCETATCIEFLKAGRRSLAKQSVKIKSDERKEHLI